MKTIHRLWPAEARCWLVVLVLVFVRVAAAQNACVLELHGTKYDVFEIPPVSGLAPDIFAITNEITYLDDGFGHELVTTVTAAGNMSGAYGIGTAGAYSPENGISLVALGTDQHLGVYSSVLDIADETGAMIGWKSDNDPTHGYPRRAFIYNADGFQFLSDLYPSVAAIETDIAGTTGVRIQSDGVMFVLDNHTQQLYRLTPEGVLTAVSLPDCGGYANDLGEYPPAGSRGGSGGCVVQNLIQGTGGDYVGRIVTDHGDGTYAVRYHKNGNELPGFALDQTFAGSISAYVPNAINADGYIGAYPGLLWSPDGDVADLREAITTQCVPDDFEIPQYVTPGALGSNTLLVNDEKWIQWSHLLLRPSCPLISLNVTGSGLQFINGKPTVNLGDRFTLTTTVFNDGRVPLEHMLVSPDPKTSQFFRLVSGPTPAYPQTLEAGASFAATAEYEAIAPGEFVGSIHVDGDANCGPIAYVQPPGTIVVLGDDITFVVNEAGDETDNDANDKRCDIDDDPAEDNCTLRAAIEEANRVTSGYPHIVFNIPGGGAPIISPASVLPVVSHPVAIDATTQPGGSVRLSGTQTGEVDGIHIAGTNDVSVKGLTITDFGGFGLRIHGGAGHTVEASNIGFLANGGAQAPNAAGGVLVAGGAADVTIGGDTEDLQNRIFGGVLVDGASGQGVTLLRNELEVDATQLAASIGRVPFDIGLDGVTCAAWADDPAGRMPPPRLLSISASNVRGMTRPGAKVVIYQVLDSGTQRGRYWSRHVKPFGFTTADGTGAFSVDVDLPPGADVTASASDAAGNSSELAQVRRPVIYLPGISGSWLSAADGTTLWFPRNVVSSDESTSRLARLTKNADGSDMEPIHIDGIVELGGYAAYGNALVALEQAGYVGATGNDAPLGLLDLWRFPYDWRDDPRGPASDLKDLVDLITVQTAQADNAIARACEADIVVHSMGGVVSSLYVRGEPAHARDHVHRWITVATPYLGAVQAAAAHTKGYIFEIEKVLHLETDWGRMIGMTRNLAGAYSLMPSKMYWETTDLESPSHQHGFVLQDLYGAPLRTYEETRTFLTKSKIDIFTGKPLGLSRNLDMLGPVSEQVHAMIDDWNAYDGPPQILREVGDMPANTATGWYIGPPVPVSELRHEEGDTRQHERYRARQLPILGYGDKTVPLVSSTMGNDGRVGKRDISGVDSPWIEPFEHFPCEHAKIITNGCVASDGSIRALDRVNEMLLSGYRVIEQHPVKGGSGKKAAAGRELLYINFSGSVAARVVDAAGRVTGAVSLDNPLVVTEDVPGVGYWANAGNATFSLPNDSTYTIDIVAGDASDVQVTRMRVSVTDDMRQTILFNALRLDAGHAIQFAFEAGGTDDDTALRVDADGDGTFEAEQAPAASTESAFGPPAIPVPQPFEIAAEGHPGEDVDVEIAFPDVGGAVWSWSLGTTAAWVQPSATAGATPGSVVLQLTALPQQGQGVQETVLPLTLRLGDFEETYAVPVSLTSSERVTAVEEGGVVAGTPEVFGLSEAYPNPFSESATVVLDVPDVMPVRVDVFDALGRRIAVLHDGVTAAGRHELTFAPAGRPGGLYIVRATGGGAVATRLMTFVPSGR
ncbi:MAG: hypothetical protein R2834_19885 [Rhodothermales bacterium]